MHQSSVNQSFATTVALHTRRETSGSGVWIAGEKRSSSLSGVEKIVKAKIEIDARPTWTNSAAEMKVRPPDRSATSRR
jgi:hypothetical protein